MHALSKMTDAIERLPEGERREAALFIYRNYGGAILEADRQKLRRVRASEALHSDEPALPGGANGTGALAVDHDEGHVERHDTRHDARTAGAQSEAVSSQTLLPPRQQQEKSLRVQTLEGIEAKDLEFLNQCPEFYKQQWLDGEWWESLKDAYPKLNMPAQVSQYLANELAKSGSRHRNVKKGLRNWCAKSEYWRERKETRR